jgi:cytochrome c peroxidase
MKITRRDDSDFLIARIVIDTCQVYDYIAHMLVEKDEYDDGSYGPVVLRLAWHCIGTYDSAIATGGSNGATMRFAPEGNHGAISGLKNARDFLEPVKGKFPWISYGDLWTLAGVRVRFKICKVL